MGTVWVGVKVLSADGTKFEIMGVFSTEQRAKDACHLINYCIGPVEMNKVLPEKTMTWPGGYYPNHPDDPAA